MDLMQVRSIYGRTYRVRKRDYYSNKVQLPLYTKGGKRYSDFRRGHPIREGGVTIHRENIQMVEHHITGEMVCIDLIPAALKHGQIVFVSKSEHRDTLYFTRLLLYTEDGIPYGRLSYMDKRRQLGITVRREDIEEVAA